MTEELELFKKKLLYRASYRGTKEMDILLSGFVKKYINEFNKKQLLELDKFLKFDDETISNFYNLDIKRKILKKTLFRIFLKNLSCDGGEGGIRTHERVAPLLVFKTSAFNRSATSPKMLVLYLLLSKGKNNNI